MGSFGGEVAAKKKAMWLYPKVMGFNPPERWGHSVCYSSRLFYVFGGCCGGLHFSDVLVLNLETMIWSNLVTTGQGPGPRDSHSAVLIDHKMIVFGGTNGSKKVSDIHILDLRSREWSQPNCQGVPPSPRESHTATLVGDDKLVIFGGSGEGGGNYLNDLHVLDLKTMHWTSPEVRGDLPVPRDSHSTVAIGRKLFVYGGDCGDRYQGDVDMLDMDMMTWTRIGVQGPSPGIRAGHAAVSVGTKVYVIGGVGDKQYYNDVWVLDINSRSWTRLEIRGQQPQGRFSHTAVVTDTDIAIYGGCGEDERPLNELLILQLGAEHPNGRYNISMCKIFGNQENKRVIQEPEQVQKTRILGSKIDMVRDKIKEAKPESKLTFRTNADNLHPKRRRTVNSEICEIESEPEEHSLSLSQHSSPSHSDQDQGLVNKATSSAKASQLFPLIKQHSLASSNCHSDIVPTTQSNSRTITDRDSQDVYVLGEKFQHPKHGHNNHVVRKDVHETHFLPAEQKSFEAGLFQNLIGANVHGKVDGAFDSGYLMTANINGRIFRGVLFPPGPEVMPRGAILGHRHSSPVNGQISRQNSHLSHSNPTIPRHSQRPVTLHSPEAVQNYRQSHVVTRPTPVVLGTLSSGQDIKKRSELQGVVLTLGGPGSIGGS